MTRLQLILLALLALAAPLAVWHAASPALLPLAAALSAAVGGLLGAMPRVPAWVVWTAVGVAASMACPHRCASHGRTCSASR